MSTSLSVIIPGYNTPSAWWNRCIKSVIAAIPEDGEVICVDDGSDCRPQVEVDDLRIKWLYLQKNMGQSVARNEAMKIARGTYITFVDSDDEVLPGVYRRVLSEVCDGPQIVIFGVRVVWWNEGLQKEDVPRARGAGRLTLPEVQELFEGCLFEYPVNKLFKRSFLNEHAISFDSGLCPGEDTIFNLKCVLADASYQFVPFVGYIYYRYFTSSLAKYQAKFDASLKMRNDLWKSLKHKLSDGKSEIPKLGELTEVELKAWGTENAWRYDSPISFQERWKMFDGRNDFVKMLIKYVIRKYFYLKIFRRMKIKKMFPHSKEVR